MTDEATQQRVDDANAEMQADVQKAEKERRQNRTLSEKLADMASTARARVDKLKAREYKLVQDLGKVRTELSQALTEVQKLEAAGAPPAPAPAAEPQPINNNGASAHAF